jgi:hypothetical protein
MGDDVRGGDMEDVGFESMSRRRSMEFETPTDIQAGLGSGKRVRQPKSPVAGRPDSTQ